MLEYGMGWIGWTEEQTLQATIPAIELAYRGRCKMISAIFGGNEPERPKPALKLTTDLFDAMFDGDK